MLAAIFLSLAFIFNAGSPVALAQQGRNSIEGTVTDREGRPLINTRVFLQDDSYSQLAMAYTDGSGRFRFTRLASGNYNVQVDPLGTDYERQSQRVEAVPFSPVAGAGEIFRVNFQLKLKKMAGTAAAANNNAADTIFYQNVPDAAKQEFARGRKNVEKGDFDAGAASLKSALGIFPDYYEAMELLGTEYVKRHEYQSALPLLERAVVINENGWRGFYSLGIALTESNRATQAVTALRRAVELNPRSPNPYMRLGMALAVADATRAEAIQTFKKVVAMENRNIPEAYLYLGRLYDMSGQLAPAIENMKSYASYAPKTDQQLPQALLYLAEMYSRNHQFNEAAEAVEASLRAAPNTSQREKLAKLAEQLRQKAAETRKRN